MPYSKVACPACGGGVKLDDNKDFGICEYCGTKIEKDKIKIDIADKITLSNNEFESKLAIADQMTEVYLNKGGQFVKYGDATGGVALDKYYHDAYSIGAHESKYWIHVSRSLLKVLIANTDKSTIWSKQTIKETITEHLDKAVLYASEDERSKVIIEKDEILKSLDKELMRFEDKQSKSGGCYIATAVYGSYDASEVKILRRYRDEIISKTRIGRMFIQVYYRISPTLASKLKCTIISKIIVKRFLNIVVEGIRITFFSENL